jgi:hypothetical protein
MLRAGILINPAGVQSQVSGINLQPTVRLTPVVARVTYLCVYQWYSHL